LADSYKTIKTPSQGIYKEKGSKFFSFAYPVSEEKEIKEILSILKKTYHDARHICFAHQTGIENSHFRVNDDGEPSGTAGKPIYGQIQSFGVTNILVVVVRYFGGILLGTGGLTNAYKTAAFEALKNAVIIEKTIDALLQVKFSYNSTKEVARCIQQFQGSIQSQQFEEICKFEVFIRKSLVNDFIDSLLKIKDTACDAYKDTNQ
jgi:uncharacterized YigZ family protein